MQNPAKFSEKLSLARRFPSDEIVKRLGRHVVDSHPDVAKNMEKLHNQDPQNRQGK
jgi:hypothetical protein